jgi:D,D-heptose 1,7-bisphosphate phosphatase
MISEAVILAGGKGTRLRERLGDLPKPLINVNGIPLLERQLCWLKRHGVTRVVLLVSHRADELEKFCRRRANDGLSIECLHDNPPSGTAGAVLRSLDRLSAEFFVVYGDTLVDVDLQRFATFHNRVPGTDISVLVHPNDHPHDSDIILTDSDDKILKVYPYPRDYGVWVPNLVSAALYIVRRDSLKRYASSHGTMDFGKHLFSTMIADSMLLRAYNSCEYIKDLGTPERLDAAVIDMNLGKIARSALTYKKKAVFLDRDGTVNKLNGYIKSDTELELVDGAAEAIKKLNKAEFKVCLVTNQPVIARGESTLDKLKIIHNKIETLLGYGGAFLDRIYFCPHHPDRGFEGEVPELKFACDCRKPAVGMMRRAVNDLNIDLENSWMIGDSVTDIEFARKSGIRSIYISQHGIPHNLHGDIIPTFFAQSLSDAVQILLENAVVE